MQKIEFTGNLTTDPAQRETASGKVTNFTVAVNRQGKVNGEKVTDFFRVGAWKAIGDNCFKYLKKGRKVFVEGELRPRLYDNDDGKTVLSLDVYPFTVEFLTPPNEEPKKEQKQITEADFIDIQSEDIPF